MLFISLITAAVADKLVWSQQCNPSSVFSTDLETGNTIELEFASGSVSFDLNETHIFWAHRVGQTAYIGKARVDGTDVNATWLTSKYGADNVAITEDTVLFTGFSQGVALFRADGSGRTTLLNTYSFSGGGQFNGGFGAYGGKGYFGADQGSFSVCSSGGVVGIGLTSNSATDGSPFACTTPFPRSVAVLASGSRAAFSDQNTYFINQFDTTTGQQVSSAKAPDRVGGITANRDGSSVFAYMGETIYRLDAPKFDALKPVASLPKGLALCLAGGAGYIATKKDNVEIAYISPDHGPANGGTTLYASLQNDLPSDLHSPVCHFGSSSANGFIAAPRIISCVSPREAGSGSSVPFFLSFQPHTRSNNVTFSYGGK